MKRYLVFIMNTYYPSGGMDDFKQDFDSLDEAIVFVQSKLESGSYQEAHVYDIHDRRVVFREDSN